jgi:hypothetical protein
MTDTEAIRMLKDARTLLEDVDNILDLVRNSDKNNVFVAAQTLLAHVKTREDYHESPYPTAREYSTAVAHAVGVMTTVQKALAHASDAVRAREAKVQRLQEVLMAIANGARDARRLASDVVNAEREKKAAEAGYLPYKAGDHLYPDDLLRDRPLFPVNGPDGIYALVPSTTPEDVDPEDRARRLAAILNAGVF